MFTGIIEAMAKVEVSGRGKLTIARPQSFRGVRVGSSICVSGVCLTVAQLEQGAMVFDVVPETMRRTILGSVKVGERVNLERALPVTGRFEGHIVQGHVDDVGDVVRTKNQAPNSKVLTVSLPQYLTPFIVEKGSITIDGVSLTVAKLKENQCTVVLIPHTLKNTTLGSLKKGDRVNVETDVLGRYVLSKLKMNN